MCGYDRLTVTQGHKYILKLLVFMFWHNTGSSLKFWLYFFFMLEWFIVQFLVPQKNVPLKIIKHKSYKPPNVQRKTLKTLQKSWRTISQYHFKKNTINSVSLEAKYKNTRGSSRLLHSTVLEKDGAQCPLCFLRVIWKNQTLHKCGTHQLSQN